jgi:hypothetical protein
MWDWGHLGRRSVEETPRGRQGGARLRFISPKLHMAAITFLAVVGYLLNGSPLLNKQ